MIRDFNLFCKLNHLKNSKPAFPLETADSFTLVKRACPSCKAEHSCSPHGSYKRNLITLEEGAVVTLTVTVRRVICSSCGRTHAVLSAALIPCASYSIFFILSVLTEYFLHRSTVEDLCRQHLISVSTLYAWIRLFYSQKKLWLGVLSDQETAPSAFLASLFAAESFLERFFQTASVSFLQPYRFTAASPLP